MGKEAQKMIEGTRLTVLGGNVIGKYARSTNRKTPIISPTSET